LVFPPWKTMTWGHPFGARAIERKKSSKEGNRDADHVETGREESDLTGKCQKRMIVAEGMRIARQFPQLPRVARYRRGRRHWRGSYLRILRIIKEIREAGDVVVVEVLVSSFIS
jgi:hypothetical protein